MPPAPRHSTSLRCRGNKKKSELVKEKPQESEAKPEETAPKEKVTGLKVGRFLDKVKAKKQAEAESNAARVSKDVSQEEITKHWEAYAQLAQSRGKMSLSMLMSRNLPQKKGSTSFIVQVDTETLKETYLAEKLSILEFISQKVQTKEFDIEVEVIKIPEEDKPKFLTNPRDKYEHMVKINPHLHLFMKELGLEFDY